MGPNLVFCCSFAARTPLTAGVTDRKTERQTDGHNKGAMDPLFVNIFKLSSGVLPSIGNSVWQGVCCVLPSIFK